MHLEKRNKLPIFYKLKVKSTSCFVSNVCTKHRALVASELIVLDNSNNLKINYWRYVVVYVLLTKTELITFCQSTRKIKKLEWNVDILTKSLYVHVSQPRLSLNITYIIRFLLQRSNYVYFFHFIFPWQTYQLQILILNHCYKHYWSSHNRVFYALRYSDLKLHVYSRKF